MQASIPHITTQCRIQHIAKEMLVKSCDWHIRYLNVINATCKHGFIRFDSAQTEPTFFWMHIRKRPKCCVAKSACKLAEEGRVTGGHAVRRNVWRSGETDDKKKVMETKRVSQQLLFFRGCWRIWRASIFRISSSVVELAAASLSTINTSPDHQLVPPIMFLCPF